MDAPFAGNHLRFIANAISKRDPIINEGIDTNAVVMIMMILSISLFLRSAAIDPRTTPLASAIKAAMRPSLAEVFIPSNMMSLTLLPFCLSDGPKSNLVTTSERYVRY